MGWGELLRFFFRVGVVNYAFLTLPLQRVAVVHKFTLSVGIFVSGWKCFHGKEEKKQ